MNYPRKSKPNSPAKNSNQQDSTSVRSIIQRTEIIRSTLDPAVLAQYEEVQPGLSSRILDLMEKKGDQSHEINLQVNKNSYLLSKGGQNKGLVAVILMIMLCGYGFHLGFAKEAAWLGAGVIVSLASIFVLGRTLGNSDKDQKKQKESS